MIDNVEKEGRIGKSDHEMISFTIKTDNRQTTKQKWYRNYRKANFVEMRSQLASINWNERLCGKNVDETWISIRGELERLTNVCVPNSQIKTQNDPKWMDRDIKKCIREKKKAWTRYKLTKTDRDKDKYRQLEKTTKNKIRNAKNRLEREIVRDAKQNPKRFYSYKKKIKKRFLIF